MRRPGPLDSSLVRKRARAPRPRPPTDNRAMIRLIVGLGNPGAEYEDTRHNAGFWWVDGAVRQLKGSLVHDPKYHGFVARVNRPEGPVWLQQPLTYMNLSGKAVAPLARFFKILPDEI